MSAFDSKIFNAEVFGKYMDTVPRVKQNQLLKAGVLRTRNELKTMLSEQAGGNYITLPMKGRIGGSALNYDGATNITADNLDTFSQSMIVIGRAKAWTEKDFSADLTGENFMDDIASQVADYWDDVDEDTLLSILKGIFGGVNDFTNKHVTDVSGVSTGVVGVTTLNTAIQKACGANKNIFKVVICHSQVATNLENLSAVEYLKYTDKDGVQRDLGLATWNGRLLLIDDEVPVANTETTAGVYKVALTGTWAEGDKLTVAGHTVTVASGSTSASAIASAMVTACADDEKYTVTSSSGNITLTTKSGHYDAGVPVVSKESEAGVATTTTTTEPVFTPKYTSYVLGEGAFDYCDVGAKVPYETDRDKKTNGGEDYLITRQRKVFAPYGFSFTKASMSSASPTKAELETASNWALVKNSAGSETIDIKAIPIAKIVSLG